MRPLKTKAAIERAEALIEEAEAFGEDLDDPLLLLSVLYGFWTANLFGFNGKNLIEISQRIMALAERQGTTFARSPIPLVRRDRGRCCSVGPFGFLKEPRPASRRRYRHEVPGGGSGSAAGEEAAIHRALHGRRDVDRSVGFVEEL